MTNLVVQLSSILVAGIECRTSNMPGAAAKDIPLLWQRFYAEGIMNKINRLSDDVYALYCEYEGDYLRPYTCMIGCKVASVENISAGLIVKEIPASTYVKYEARGAFPQSVLNTWVGIWKDNTLNRSYAVDFEVYDKRFATEKDKPVDVFVGIKK